MDEYQLHLVRESLKTLDRYKENPTEFMEHLVEKGFYVEPQVSIWNHFGVLVSHSEVFQKEYVKNVLHNQPAPGRTFWKNYIGQINGFLSYMANRPEEKEKVLDHAIISYAQSSGISAEQLAALRENLKNAPHNQKEDFIDQLLKGKAAEKQIGYQGTPPELLKKKEKTDEETKTEEEKKPEEAPKEQNQPKELSDQQRRSQEQLLGNAPYTAQVPAGVVSDKSHQPQKSVLFGEKEKPLAAGLETFRSPENPEETNPGQRIRSVLSPRKRFTPEAERNVEDKLEEAEFQARMAYTKARPRFTGVVGDFARTAQRQIFGGPNYRQIIVTSQPMRVQQMTSRGPITSTVNVLKTAARVRNNFNNARMGAQIAGKGAQLAGRAAIAAGEAVAANPVSLVVIGVIVVVIILVVLLLGSDTFGLVKSTALCGLPDSACGKTPPEQVELQNVISLLKGGSQHVNQGEDIAYNITATYTGAGVADMTVSDTVPAGTTYVSYSAAPENAPSTVTFDGTTVTWTINNAPENTPQLFFFVVKAPDEDTWIQNTATAKVINTSLLFQGENTAPNQDNCNGKWGPSSYFGRYPQNGNFGDPNCDFSLDALHQLLVNEDQANADYWFKVLIPCESTYDPNAFLRNSTSGLGAYGLFQMNPNPPKQPPDVGNVIWQIQVANAIAYEKLLASTGQSWHYWACARARW